jgi:enoyl-CoA hydratase
MPVPVVVAVQGHAIGLGATIVSACDVSVAWRHARISDPHVHVGLVAGDGGVLGWSAAVGYNRARRMLLTGDAITAEQAYDFGLITDLVDTPEAALGEARRIAEQIARLPPVAVQGTKKVFNALARLNLANVLDISLMAEMASVTSEDLQEALRAVQEKRPGQYRNL